MNVYQMPVHICQKSHPSHILWKILTRLFSIGRWAKLNIHKTCPYILILKCLIHFGNFSRHYHLGILEVKYCPRWMGTSFSAKVNLSELGVWPNQPRKVYSSYPDLWQKPTLRFTTAMSARPRLPRGRTLRERGLRDDRVQDRQVVSVEVKVQHDLQLL